MPICQPKSVRCINRRSAFHKFWKGSASVSLIFRNLVAAVMVLTFLGGCATVKPGLPHRPSARTPEAKPRSPKSQPSKPVVKKRMPANPTPKSQDSARTVVVLSLVDQGRAYLSQNRPDAAIRVLERAVNINPQRGESYYYLAEAWLMKENFSQALEYNRLAGTYLGSDSEWAGRLKTQQLKISRK